MKKSIFYFLAIFMISCFAVGCDGQQDMDKLVGTRVSKGLATSIGTQNHGMDSEMESISFTSQSRTTTFKKTHNKCRRCRGCGGTSGCTGYWGIYHDNGTYEGPCRNRDGCGYTCNHGPEDHGLRRW